jgi:hypothetical protein
VSVRETIKASLERAGKIAADIYIGFLGLGILLGFPILCILGLIYIGVWAGSLVGGVLGVVLFLGLPFFLLLFFSIYAWAPYVWPTLQRALRELQD